jgi:hypothetical protein
MVTIVFGSSILCPGLSGEFFLSKPDILMACGKVELRFIESDNELPAVMFDGRELAQWLN